MSDPSEPVIDMRREPSGGVDWEPRADASGDGSCDGRLRSGGRGWP